MKGQNPENLAIGYNVFEQQDIHGISNPTGHFLIKELRASL